MSTKFQTIIPSEIQDFRNSCQKLKINPDDFILNEHDVIQTPAGNGLFHLNGRLTVSRNGKSKTYDSGNGTSWPAAFDSDLTSGVFN